MATESKTATEEVKIDLFEDDDEFEEFEINEGTVNHLGKKTIPLFDVLHYCLQCILVFRLWLADVDYLIDVAYKIMEIK